MTPQAAAYLEKADEALSDARGNLGIKINRQAARLAYYAAFHAAQALIFEREGRAAKTHKGVNARFAKIVLDGSLAPKLSEFLAGAYHFKSAVDYETGSLRVIGPDEAAEALHDAEHFVATIKDLLAADDEGTVGPPATP